MYLELTPTVFTVQCNGSAVYAVAQCPAVCLSQARGAKFTWNRIFGQYSVNKINNDYGGGGGEITRYISETIREIGTWFL